MKKFNLEAAKQGHPICTRDERRARLIFTEALNDRFPLVALIDDGDDEVSREIPETYTMQGRFLSDSAEKSEYDLFMVDDGEII